MFFACKDIQYSLLISASKVINARVKDACAVLPLLIPLIIVLVSRIIFVVIKIILVAVMVISVVSKIIFVIMRIIFVVVKTTCRQCKNYLRRCRIYLRGCKKIRRKASHVPRLWAQIRDHRNNFWCMRASTSPGVSGLRGVPPTKPMQCDVRP